MQQPVYCLKSLFQVHDWSPDMFRIDINQSYTLLFRRNGGFKPDNPSLFTFL
jgi:hypothetical protein